MVVLGGRFVFLFFSPSGLRVIIYFFGGEEGGFLDFYGLNGFDGGEDWSRTNEMALRSCIFLGLASVELGCV